MVKIVSPKGKLISVTNKAFKLIYRPKGYTLAPGSVLPASPPDESEPAELLDDSSDLGADAAAGADLNANLKDTAPPAPAATAAVRKTAGKGKSKAAARAK